MVFGRPLVARVSRPVPKKPHSSSPAPDGVLIDKDGNFLVDKDGNHVAAPPPAS